MECLSRDGRKEGPLPAGVVLDGPLAIESGPFEQYWFLRHVVRQAEASVRDRVDGDDDARPGQAEGADGGAEGALPGPG